MTANCSGIWQPNNCTNNPYPYYPCMSSCYMYSPCMSSCMPNYPPYHPDCGHHGHHHKKCDPRIGELVHNGGFESGLLGWTIEGAVRDMVIFPGHTPHQGTEAAAVGLFDEPWEGHPGRSKPGNGSIYQDISGICPGISYQFTFFMSPHGMASNGRIVGNLVFLDENKDIIPNSGVSAIIEQGFLLYAWAWMGYTNNAVAPEGAYYARITISKSGGGTEEDLYDQHVHIDDVSLIAVE